MIGVYLTAYRDKEGHEAVHALLDYLLKKNGFADVKIVTSEHGKPYAEGGELFFSLSHSGGYAAVALSDSEIGIDIEVPKQRSDERLVRLAKQFFSDEEYGRVIENPQKNFYRIWTAKESRAKFSGEGFAFGIKSVCADDGLLHINRFDTEEFFGCVCSREETAVDPLFVDIDEIFKCGD